MKEEQITQLEAKVDLLKKVKRQISELTRILDLLNANNDIYIHSDGGCNQFRIGSNVLTGEEIYKLFELIWNYILKIKESKQDELDSVSLLSLMADIEKDSNKGISNE